MTETSAADEQPAVAKKKNVFERIAGVLFAPAETFADIARRPDLLGPLALMILLGYISTALIMPRVDFDAVFEAQEQEMRKRDPNVSQEQIDQIARFSRASMTVWRWIGPVVGILIYVVIAAVLLLAVRLFGGEGNFKQALSASIYAWVPLLLYSLILTIVVVARGTFDPITAATLVKSNPAFLVDLKTQPVLFSLFSALDVFTIWTVILLVFGFAALSRLSRGMVAAIVVPLWLVFVLLRVAFVALTTGAGS
ncbi:MAG TPA: Yip1 family protein [Thermoanaerobaculia bacterium]|jgi:hypothetical protein|nr:Yip1 family protein [Thermoanaerobaculia bacterium]